MIGLFFNIVIRRGIFFRHGTVRLSNYDLRFSYLFDGSIDGSNRQKWYKSRVVWAPHEFIVTPKRYKSSVTRRSCLIFFQLNYNTLFTTPHWGFSVTMQFKRGNNSNTKINAKNYVIYI